MTHRSFHNTSTGRQAACSVCRRNTCHSLSLAYQRSSSIRPSSSWNKLSSSLVHPPPTDGHRAASPAHAYRSFSLRAQNPPFGFRLVRWSGTTTWSAVCRIGVWRFLRLCNPPSGRLHPTRSTKNIRICLDGLWAKTWTKRLFYRPTKV